MSNRPDVPERVAEIKANAEEILQHPLDLVYVKASAIWKLRYVNQGGVPIFSATIVFQNKRWKLQTFSHVLPMSQLVEEV